MSKPFFVYILRCADGSYYVGQTDELMKRIGEHQAGKGCTYTRKRCPVEFLWRAEFATREEAKEMEARIKGWSRAKKEALMKNDWERIKQLGSRSTQGRAPFVKLAALVPQGRVRDCFPTTLRRPKAISKGTDAGNSSWGINDCSDPFRWLFYWPNSTSRIAQEVLSQEVLSMFY